MEPLIYLIEVSAGIALFFAFYLLVLRKLTFFKLSRLYLLSALFLSFSIPALQFKIEKVIELKQIIQPSPIAVNFSDAIKTNTIEVKEMPVESTFDWLLIVPFAYWITALTIVCFGFYRVYQLIKFTRANSRLYSGLKIISKTSGFTNCSFFNYVFIDETNLSETDLQVLLKHEQVHAEQYHSIDKLIMMIAKALL
ncbi:hypothetical protein [Pedobacter aquatilis]|uniref:hypothetical protein n=1 Tax=Pedobacter aquatilis TaxID=351343 RepID=UPI00292F7681|nr:hypothetical protein [Pedobacter aquatilis]